MDLESVLTDTARSIALFLPKALAFIAILVVAWLAAGALRTLTDKILERVGFDRLAERGGVAAWLARGRYDASDLVARLVYYAVLLFGLQLAFGIWGPNPVSDLINAVVAWLPQAFVAILIIVVATAIASWVKDIVTAALGGLSYGRTLGRVASVFIIGLGVIAALNQIGVATTVTTPILIAALATVAGILIVGVGGGLIRPMQSRWDSWLDRAGSEYVRVADHARAYAAGQADATQIVGERTSTVYQSAEAPAAQQAAIVAPTPPAGQRDDRDVPAEDDMTQVLPGPRPAAGRDA
ncbi:mechanosensitive ion channel family protein [Catellatospora vulcania]|uniref:mechanosensitive ion channel family protein n=1 Tax=Catellatospora vulcania TaxID=1460450 RepID=UPI0012D42B75|nr:hypothetical protein [Catellatospora vulcania]